MVHLLDANSAFSAVLYLGVGIEIRPVEGKRTHTFIAKLVLMYVLRLLNQVVRVRIW